MNTKFFPTARLAAALAAAMLVSATASASAADAAGGEKLVPLEIKLPKLLFDGTPKTIKPAPTLEKYDKEPRPPFYAPAGLVNLAAGKKVTSSDMAPIIGELNLVTDGDKDGVDGSYVELGPGKQWLQIDLGAAVDIYAVLLWHFHKEARVYHDVIVQVSEDPDFVKDVKTIFNNDFDNSAGIGLGKDLEYVDDNRGKLIDAKNAKGEPARGRYVRFWSNGSTSNDVNHYIEVEVFGKPVK